MTTVIVGALLLWLVFGRTRGMLGGLVGGFIAALVLAGMVTTTLAGALAALHSPGRLAYAAAPLTAVAAGLALIVPYATGVAALGWGAGALLAALAATRTGQAAYVLPLAVHVLAAATVAGVARCRVAGRSAPHEREGSERLVSRCRLPAAKLGASRRR
jgi:hypothetical protein